MIRLLCLLGVLAGFTLHLQATEVLTRGPYLNLATDTSVVVRWRTNLPAASRVAYGSSPATLNSWVDVTASNPVG